MKAFTAADLGATIREARINAGLTQTQLGWQIGVTRFWVASFERGNPGAEIELVIRALAALNLTLTVSASSAKTVTGDSVAAGSSSSPHSVDLESILRVNTATGSRNSRRT